MADRRIILHPGFPKCATSSLQRLFTIRNHELSKSIGITTLGRGFLPDNGYPEVSKLMYDKKWCFAELEKIEYQEGRYFLSNEALAGAPDFVTAIKRIFEVDNTIFTTRLPSLQALSNYCFSGWLTNDYPELLISGNIGVFSAASRMRGKLKLFRSICERVTVCPIEARIPQVIR